ncbi:helix-turn-helix transcriptional regulator [Paenibacillus sp. S150]|uniref:helix-turn-helix domain-containing protein n=1 Tax=Paenibacillus sp. S150 TaxID=2749826 RepID=UPI001C56A99A|nr:helix-turn-helix transcriptional regulator [Paenibacillus sp. S150]MBW4085773.1 helix-turn-helix transcriptional regulator [Paenibacillus sp. S150]
MEPAPAILAELENYLKREGLTITQFSERSGIHSGTLSNMIRGRRPVAIQQLDRITGAMGLAEGFFYDLYIDNYIIDSSQDWRRIGPLLHRCADLNKLDCIGRVVQHIMDNLMYSPLLYDTAEELFAKGRPAAAALLYEGVSEGERSQHSERLALCQYRLFTISLCDDQDKNLCAATRFEPFVERLDEIVQLDALKELANTYRSLQRWSKVDELAGKMGSKAKIQYDLQKRPQRKSKPSVEGPGRPLFFYIAYSSLLRGNACNELGDYGQALTHINNYADLSWVKEQGEDVEYWKSLFIEWAEANTCLTRLLGGDLNVIEQYAAYIDRQKEERVTGLLYILKAANKYDLNVDEILQRFKQDIEETINVWAEGRYSRKLAMDRQANLLLELAQYLLNQQDYDNGLKFLQKAMKDYKQINHEKYKMLAVTANILRDRNNTSR